MWLVMYPTNYWVINRFTQRWVTLKYPTITQRHFIQSEIYSNLGKRFDTIKIPNNGTLSNLKFTQIWVKHTRTLVLGKLSIV